MDELNMNFLTLGISDDSSEVHEVSILDQPLSPPQSPPRKRFKATHSEATHSDASIGQTFADFDALPVYARGASKWNHLLAANPTFWTLKCTSWYQTLQTAFKEKNVRQARSNMLIHQANT